MRFTELPESERIEKVKDSFTEILATLAEDQTKIAEYIPVPTKPKDITDQMSETEKTAISKLKAEFDEKTTQVAKVKEILSQVQRPEGCFCGTCVDVKFGTSIPRELECLIEFAQKQAEKATY